jgi:hypothetical protein
MGWAAAAVSTLLFGVGVYQQANTSYRQRYAGFSWEAIFDSLWQVSLRPTLRNWKTKIALGAWICFYLIAVGRVSWTDHLDSMQKITELRTKNQELEGRLKARTVEASRLVNPDEANRLRALRDKHFELLRPVLRSESTHLKSIAEQIRTQGHLGPVRESDAKISASAELWPEVMSRDLANHFGEYDEAKHNLKSEIDASDAEFRQALSGIEKEIKPAKDLTPNWIEMSAVSFVEKCLGHGDGLRLRVNDSGYSFEYLGGGGTNSGPPGPNAPRPPPDLVAAALAYQSIEPNAMGPHCESLKRRVERIKTIAEDLSKRAILLSEGVVLNGVCEFLKKVD